MREIVLDTETTGLDFNNGDKMVEIGLIELENHVQTGKYFHYYLNPEKESDLQALKVHGLTSDFLKDKPKFIDIVDQFIDFIADSKIIIHNAPFDLGFINNELRICCKSELKKDNVIDTLLLAKKRFVGQSVSLDALCRKFNIDISGRQIHGALKDAKLLASVYLELMGGKQIKLAFNEDISLTSLKNEDLSLGVENLYKTNQLRPYNNRLIDVIDNDLHIESIKEIHNSIWRKLIN